MAFLNLNKNLMLYFKVLVLYFYCSTMAFSASLEQLKTAFIFNFANYVSWPESSFQSSQSPFTICIDADRSFTELMKLTVKGETINSRPFHIVRVSDTANIKQCQILYFAASEAYKVDALTTTLALPILLVSDYKGFSSRGGMIELREQDQRLKLLINLKSVSKSGLSILSNLLNLATIVD